MDCFQRQQKIAFPQEGSTVFRNPVALRMSLRILEWSLGISLGTSLGISLPAELAASDNLGPIRFARSIL